MIPYVIVAQRYVHNSAGVTVMHRLAKELAELGIPTYITGRTIPGSGARPITIDTHVRRPFIAVYSEVMPGNPMQAPHVVRYVLNNPGLLGGEKKYDPSEKVFVYNHALIGPAAEATPQKITEESVMFMPTADTKLFRDMGLPRSKQLFYKGKMALYPHTLSGAVEISRGFPPRREDVVLFLNQATELVTLDGFTAMIDEARLCGTPVLILDPSRDREFYRGLETGDSGIRLVSELKDDVEQAPAEWTKEEKAEFRRMYQAHVDAWPARLKKFVEETQP